MPCNENGGGLDYRGKEELILIERRPRARLKRQWDDNVKRDVESQGIQWRTVQEEIWKDSLC